jgi:coenzyme F420-0:L-glutamate ligase/coenzyme F420-1:gamma-L-glutamate ligase
MSLQLQELRGIPLIQPGDDLVEIILNAIKNQKIELLDGDVLVLAQKIVSKAEGRLVNLTTVQPSNKAIEIAEKCQKDARFIELVLNESKEILRIRQGLVIVEHKNGFVCANAGIDHSNVMGSWGSKEDWYLLLPEDPDLSARRIRDGLYQKGKASVGIAIIDSHGRAWREGVVGVAIGVAGIPALVDLRGKPDLFGYELKVTQIAAVDELAAAASLLMGQAAEGSPIIHVRGFPYPLRESSLSELIRPKDLDLFR